MAGEVSESNGERGAEDITLRIHAVEGPGSIQRLGEEARSLGRHALLVTDAGVVAAGHVERAESILRAAGVEVSRFDDVHPNPTTDDVKSCAALAASVRPDLLIGFGGGSSIDVAKGTNFQLTGDGELSRFLGRGPRPGEEGLEFLPLLAVPTTAGTGTDAQSFALVADAKTHKKMALGHPGIMPRVAILDAELTLSQPTFVTACTGLDAVGHAVETLVTRRRSEVSTSLARESFRLSIHALPRVLEAPDDVDARTRMLRAAFLAGRAIENSMLGAAHAMSNPLTARFDVAHGQAVATALPHVVRYNATDPETAAAYADLAVVAGLSHPGTSKEQAIASLVRALEDLLDRAGLPRSLAELGVRESDRSALAEEAAQQWTAGFNPRAATVRDFEGLFAEAGAA